MSFIVSLCLKYPAVYVRVCAMGDAEYARPEFARRNLRHECGQKCRAEKCGKNKLHVWLMSSSLFYVAVVLSMSIPAQTTRHSSRDAMACDKSLTEYRPESR